MNESRGRRDNEPAYVLHTYPFRETSLVVELFTRNCGRVALIARGAKRPKSAVRGVLLPFQPLAVGWFGKSELRTLASAAAAWRHCADVRLLSQRAGAQTDATR
jgi:DNA repair protein RecO (recombination protein O)